MKFNSSRSDDEDGPAVEDNDPAEARPTGATSAADKQADTNTVNMRSYDLYITYDRLLSQFY